MSGGLERDLRRWEVGEIPREQLQHVHPDVDIVALTGLHASLSSLLDAPAPDPDTAWSAVLSHLPARPPISRRPPFRRPVIAAVVAAVLAVPTVSYAAAPDLVRSAVRRVTDLMPGVTGDGDHGDKDDGGAPTTSDGVHPAVEETGSDQEEPTAPSGPTDADPAADGTEGSGETGDGATSDDITPDDATDADLGHDGSSSPPDSGTSGEPDLTG